MEKAGEGLLQSLLCGLPSLAETPPMCTRLRKERCSAAWGEPCSSRQAAAGSTAHLEIWSGLYFHQDTGIVCGILHLAQRMGQASHLGVMRNSVTAVCLPLPPLPASPAHPERAVGQRQRLSSHLKAAPGPLSFTGQCPPWH